MCESSLGVLIGVGCCRLKKGAGDNLKIATIEVVVGEGLAAAVWLDEQWWWPYFVEGTTLKVSRVCRNGVMEPWK